MQITTYFPVKLETSCMEIHPPTVSVLWFDLEMEITRLAVAGRD